MTGRDRFAGLRAVDTGLGPRERATLALIAEFLTGGEPEWLTIPSGLPPSLPAHHRRTWDRFTATPVALRESWRVARHLDAATAPGDVLLMSDRDGRAGMFALEQAAAGDARRNVVVTAADSAVLEYSAVAGTIEGAAEDVDHAMDWELAAYRHAALVAATSVLARDTLAGLGIGAQLTVSAEPGLTTAIGPSPVGSVGLPEPVARLSGSGPLLRGLSGTRDAVPDLRITASTEDRPDHLFAGTTWETLAGVRRLLGGALQRMDAPDGELLLLGDPFAAPPAAVSAARAAGRRVAVRAGSCAAARWPDAPAWRDEADVAALVSGIDPPVAGPANPPDVPELRVAPTAPDRANRISVGVPVFGDAAYLDDCLRSILAQDQPAHEVLVIDDGSRSAAVAAVVARWETNHPDLVRGLVQSPNQGVSAARNRALAEMTGDAFLFVDADDELDHRFLSACAGALRADASLWAVATWTEFFGTYAGIEAKPPFDRRVGLRENPIISTLVLVDMKVRDLGLRFAPDLAFIFCEDWELWSRIVAAGGRFGLVPEPLARHRVHPASGGFQRTELAARLGRARAVAPLRQAGATIRAAQ